MTRGSILDAMPPPLMLGGLRVVTSPLLEGLRLPVRTLAFKPWMKGRCYHARVQKKWNKRYGTEPAGAILAGASGTLYVSPRQVAMIRGLANPAVR